MKILYSILIMLLFANIAFSTDIEIVGIDKHYKHISVVQKPVSIAEIELIKNKLLNSSIYTPDTVPLIIDYYEKLISTSNYKEAMLILLNITSIFKEQKFEYPEVWGDFIQKQDYLLSRQFEKNPNNADVIALLSCLNYHTDNFEEAIELARKAQSLNPDKYHDLVGNIYLAENVIDKAKLEFEKSLPKYSNNYDMQYKLSLIAFSQKNIQTAVKYSKTVIKSDYRFKAKAIRNVYWSLKSKKYSDYMLLSNLVSEEQLKDNIGAYDLLYTNLAIYCVEHGEVSTAMALLEDSVKINPTNYSSYLLIAKLLVKTNHKEEAKKVLEYVDYNFLSVKLKQWYQVIKSTIK